MVSGYLHAYARMQLHVYASKYKTSRLVIVK